jgi:hemoglobin
MVRRTPLLAALFIMGSVAAAGDAARSRAPVEPLFERLGGTARVTAFVDATVDELAADPQGGPVREGLDLQAVKAELVARICALSGGGCRYRHNATALQASTGLVEVLRVAMRAHGVPLSARNELLETLAPTRRDVARL